MNNLLLRRRALMGMGGEEEEYALTKKNQPVILAAFYNAGLCASPDYMTIEEAGLITNSQFNTVNFKDAVEDFSGFRYFTSVTTVAQQRFDKYNITKIICPDTVITFDKFAFNECNNLRFADIGNNITSIGGHTFRACRELPLIIIGNSVNSIGTQFAADIKNSTIICKSIIPPTLGTNAFHNNTMYSSVPAVIYVPDESLNDYQTDSEWGQYTLKPMSEYDGDLI